MNNVFGLSSNYYNYGIQKNNAISHIFYRLLASSFKIRVIVTQLHIKSLSVYYFGSKYISSCPLEFYSFTVIFMQPINKLNYQGFCSSSVRHGSSFLNLQSCGKSTSSTFVASSKIYCSPIVLLRRVHFIFVSAHILASAGKFMSGLEWPRSWNFAQENIAVPILYVILWPEVLARQVYSKYICPPMTRVSDRMRWDSYRFDVRFHWKRELHGRIFRNWP